MVKKSTENRASLEDLYKHASAIRGFLLYADHHNVGKRHYAGFLRSILRNLTNSAWKDLIPSELRDNNIDRTMWTSNKYQVLKYLNDTIDIVMRIKNP